MRITGGEYAGRVLTIPKGPRIRETTDQTRKNLFHLLADRLAGTRVLDLFCGTGSLGLEALSRGAAHVTFVDRSAYCIRAVQANLDSLLPVACHLSPVTVLRADALAAIRRLGREGKPLFDLVFLDPPYGAPRAGSGGDIRRRGVADRRDWAKKTLNALSRHAIVFPFGLVIAEHDKRDPLPSEIQGEEVLFILQRQVRYGDTALTIYQRQ